MALLRQTLWLAGFLLCAHLAHAQSVCPGTMRASLVHPVPTPLVVGPDRSLVDMRNPGLAAHFVAGLQQAGVNVAEQGANATMAIAVSVTAEAGSNVRSGSYKSFEWTSGEPAGEGHGKTGIRSARLTISAILTDNVAVSQSWVATLDCRVQTDDPTALAEFLGKAIGQTVGKNIDRKVI